MLEDTEAKITHELFSERGCDRRTVYSLDESTGTLAARGMGKRRDVLSPDNWKEKRWAEEEIALVREHYETMSRERLMQLLPDRVWISIGVYARKILGMKRKQAENILSVGSENGARPDRELSYEDLAYMQSKDIPFDARSTNWEVQY